MDFKSKIILIYGPTASGKSKFAIQLAKKALAKDPKYVNYDYRKEQLWGEKLQASTEILLQNEQLKKDVIIAKSKISESS